MASEAEIEAAARAIYEADPIPMKMFDHDEIKDLARAALEAAERVRKAAQTEIVRSWTSPLHNQEMERRG